MMHSEQAFSHGPAAPLTSVRGRRSAPESGLARCLGSLAMLTAALAADRRPSGPGDARHPHHPAFDLPEVELLRSAAAVPACVMSDGPPIDGCPSNPAALKTQPMRWCVLEDGVLLRDKVDRRSTDVWGFRSPMDCPVIVTVSGDGKAALELAVHDDLGRQLACDDGAGSCCAAGFRAPACGRFWVSVRNRSNAPVAYEMLMP